MVTLENYEEYMLLDADGELDAGGQQALGKFLKMHPALKQEHELYMATRLVPDAAIVYADKPTLMKPEQEKRVIPMRAWWAVSAAACIAVLVYLSVANSDEPVPHLVANNTPRPTPPVVQQQQIPAQPSVDNSFHSSPVGPITGVEQDAAKPLPSKKAMAISRNEEIAKTDNGNENNIEEVIEDKPLKIAVITSKPFAMLEYELPQPAIAATVVVPEPPVDKQAKRGKMIDDDMPNGIKELEYALAEKVKDVKSIRNRVKDTDVSIRLGNKELLTLKF